MEVLVKHIGTAFSVAAIPVLQDNFTYVIHDKTTNTLGAVDVSSDTEPVVRYVRSLGAGASFRAILSTHKHWDHTGGNLSLPKLLGAAAPLDIIGGASEPVPGATRGVREGDTLRLGSLEVAVLDAPCHTRGHVLYRVHHPQRPGDGAALFTGDTMFIGGVGAFFEGDAAMMCRALRKVFHLNGGAAPGEADERTHVFPGHEYTVNFLRFAAAALPAAHPDAPFLAAQLARYERNVAQRVPTVPSTLAEEKRQNLFLRTCDEAFVAAMGHGRTAEELMQHLYDTCP